MRKRLPWRLENGNFAIPLANSKAGVFAVVSPEDVASVSMHNWSVYSKGYAAATIAGVKTSLHRFILRPPISLQVDHRNGDPLDCTRDNIRLATHSQNTHNVGKHRSGESRFKGISRARADRWRAQICVEGSKKNLGVFDSEEDAARAYDAAATEHFGEFARLNFPSQFAVADLAASATIVKAVPR